MKVWVTRYALTKGIYEADVKDFGDGIVMEPGAYTYLHGEGRDWHRTKDEAVARAEKM